MTTNVILYKIYNLWYIGIASQGNNIVFLRGYINRILNE